VAVAAILGAIKLRDPKCTDLLAALSKETFLFHGAGSANLGTAALLKGEAGVPASSIFITNSRGVVWCYIFKYLSICLRFTHRSTSKGRSGCPGVFDFHYKLARRGLVIFTDR